MNLPPSELTALSDLYYSTNGPFWKYFPNETHWNFNQTNPNPCLERWAGIFCDYTSDPWHVKALLLGDHNLTGTLPISLGNLTGLIDLGFAFNSLQKQLPESIGYLSHLINLTLRYNYFTGPLPKTIYYLHKLEMFDLQKNFFDGSINEKGLNNLTSLQIIDFNHNLFHCTLPNSIGQLQSLQTLRIADNYFYGSLPESIYQLTQLKSLYIAINHFNSTISSNISNFHSLQFLDIAVNEFTGSIPNTFGNLTSVVAAALSYNRFVGSLPNTLGGMRSLIAVDFASNLLSKSLPEYIGNVNEIRIIYLDNNSFTGIIPITYGKNITNLLEFIATKNFFRGKIPEKLLNLQNLRTIILSNNLLTYNLPNIINLPKIDTFTIDENYLTGTIPTSIGMNCLNLTYFDVSTNKFISILPNSFNNLQRLRFLYAHNNQFSGSITFSITSLYQLIEIFLYNNRFVGSLDTLFPTSLINEKVNNPQLLRNLSSVDVSENGFTGTLPTALFNISSSTLKAFVASSNCFSGSLPNELCSMKSLKSLILDGLSSSTLCRIRIFPHLNHYFTAFLLKRTMDGTISTCLYSLPKLEQFHLSGNGFTGSLPNNVELPTSFNNLVLSHNYLTGTIPLIFQQRNWSTIDLSYNRLTGKIYPYSFTLFTEGSVYLEENRLSGHVPHSLKEIENIYILRGNMMTCNMEKTNVPQHDPNLDIYDCGSDSVNNSFFAYITCFGLLLMNFLLLECIRRRWYMRNNREEGEKDSENSFFSQYHKTILIIYELLFHPNVHEDPNIFSIIQFMQKIRYITGYLTFFILLILLPIYITLSESSYSMYEYRYIWMFSSIFFTGLTPAIVLFVFFCLFVLWVAYVFYTYLIDIYLLDDIIMDENQSRNSKRVPRRLMRGKDGRVSGTNPLQPEIRASQGTMSTCSDFPTGPVNPSLPTSVEQPQSSIWQRLWEGCQRNLFPYFILSTRTKGLILISIINCIVMIIVDLIYVYIIIHYSSSIVIISELMMSLFRIYWNDVAIWQMIIYLREIIIKKEIKIILQEMNNMKTKGGEGSELANNPLYERYQLLYQEYLKEEEMKKRKQAIQQQQLNKSRKSYFSGASSFHYSPSSVLLSMRKSNFRVTLLTRPASRESSLVEDGNGNGNGNNNVKNKLQFVKSMITTSEMRFIPRTEENEQQTFPLFFDPNTPLKPISPNDPKEDLLQAIRSVDITERPSQRPSFLRTSAANIDNMRPSQAATILTEANLKSHKEKEGGGERTSDHSMSSAETVNRTTTGFRYTSADFALNEAKRTVIGGIIRESEGKKATNNQDTSYSMSNLLSARLSTSFNLYDDHITMEDIFNGEKDIIFLIIIILLNNIIIPCIAVSIISGRCFNNAIFASPSVTTSYNYYECSVYTPIRIAELELCDKIGQTTRNITYDPPFSYNYECSSVLLTKFASVFVYMILFAGILLPICKLLLAGLYRYCLRVYRQSFQFSWYDDVLLSLLTLPLIPLEVFIHVDTKARKYLDSNNDNNNNRSMLMTGGNDLSISSSLPPSKPPPRIDSDDDGVIQSEERRNNALRISQVMNPLTNQTTRTTDYDIEESLPSPSSSSIDTMSKGPISNTIETDLPLINGTLFNREKFIIKVTNYILINLL